MIENRSLKRLDLLSAVLLGGYAATSLWLGPGHRLLLFGAATLCLLPLIANLGLLANANSRYRRQNAFWALWAAACVLWSLGQLLWAIALLSRSQREPTGLADVLFFLSVVPMLAALSVRPHLRRPAKALTYGYMDLALLTTWCLYLFGFCVVAPEAASFSPGLYQQHYLELVALVNLVLVAFLLSLWRTTRGDWHRLYGQLLGACSLHAVAWLLIRWAIAHGAYYTGSLSDLPLLASFLWFAFAGLDASQLSLEPQEYSGAPIDHRWALRMAVAGIVSLPLLGAWAMLAPATPDVRRVRVDLTLGGIAIGILLLLLRQRQVDNHRRSLLLDKQLSLDKTNRLQTHLVLTEKLASLGELAAGAAHEIGDPLTAVFGYTELLLAEPELDERVRSAAQKIRVQAHRTRALVDSLLRFARQVSHEKALLDLNALLSSAVQLHRFHLSDRDIVVKLDLGSDLPAVRGDPKLLLQVFYEIINNAADAMLPAGGGHLAIRTRLEGTNVGVDFADNGPGLEHPERVFDPFFTTKDVGKGTGLGLSVCYGIIKEHGGQISCRNLPEGGALFRVELPAIVLPLQLKNLLESAARAS